MQKLHKPAEQSKATLQRQGKHIKVKDKPIKEPVVLAKQEPLADMDMLKDELIEMAAALDLSTKGTKAELVARINA